MPADYLRSHDRLSKTYKKDPGSFAVEKLATARYPNNTKNTSLNGKLMFSRQCVSILIKIECMLRYCSVDKERILTEYSWKTCKEAVDTW